MTYGDTCGKFKLCMPNNPPLANCTECLDYWAPKSELTVKLSGGKFGIYPYLPVDQSFNTPDRTDHQATPKPAIVTIDDTLTIPIAEHQPFGWSYQYPFDDPAAAGFNPTFGYAQGVSEYAVIPSSFREFAVNPSSFPGNPGVAYVEVGLFWHRVGMSCVNNQITIRVELGICHTPFYYANSNQVQTPWLSPGNNPYTYAEYLVGPEANTGFQSDGRFEFNVSEDDCRRPSPFPLSPIPNALFDGLWVYMSSVPDAQDITVEIYE